jgi:competence/damage-inducible protein CinA-like protein
MPSAEIISIGTEILLGEIVDTNAYFIARKLRDAGIDLYRKTTVGDNSRRIAQAIQQALERSDIIITTGGLGPTIDDATREGVAQALGVETEFHDELWEQIQARFKRFNRIPTENNKRQAYIPQGSIAVENPVGTAPSFIVENNSHTIISLPGVPREMEYLLEKVVLPYLRESYQIQGIIKARVLHTAGVGESQIDDLISDLEELQNPTIGLAAHSGQVDVRITAKANTEEQADKLIYKVEGEVRKRLGKWIYGVDQDTLEKAALKTIQNRGWTLAVIETGLKGDLIRRLSKTAQDGNYNLNNVFHGGEMIIESASSKDLHSLTVACRKSRNVDVCLGVAIRPAGEKQDVCITIITPEGEQNLTRPYGGPPEYAPRWALNHSLNLLRNL